MIGSKAANLIRIRDEFGFDVPEFEVFEFSSLFSNTETLEFDESYVEQAIALVTAKGWNRVSFRTSAALEDSAGNSFAGQYETYLDVALSADSFRQHAKLCFQSMLTDRVRLYAKNQQIEGFVAAGSLIVQEMFYGSASGVLFSENGKGALEISYTDSWRNLVVEGEEAHSLTVPRNEIDSFNGSEQIRQLCAQALTIEAAIGVPVDVEFAFDNSKLMLLQFRPITVANLDYLLEWDSTNISENYPGITLPLTYSVIRQLYAGVYPAFLRLLGTPEKVLTEHGQVFENMLGYLNGRVYYRITSWYETLKLLPGRRNQEYFEAMLNPVKKRGQNAGYAKGIDLRSIMLLIKFAWLLARSESYSRRFRDHIAKRISFYESYRLDFLNVASVVNASKQIRAELLNQWAVPILNDVKLMVYHGILKTVFFKGDHQREYLEFLQGLTDRASIKPLEGLAFLGREVSQLMTQAKASSISELKASTYWPKAVVAVTEYNKVFGARTPDELKLENTRLGDSTSDLLELALKAGTGSLGNDSKKPNSRSKTAWPKHVPVWQRGLLRHVALQTRKAIDWRERFRFNRSQTFNLSRNAFDAIGKALCAEGLIANERDIYWLTEHEIDEIVNGHAWSVSAIETVSARKAKFSEYESLEMSLAVHGAGRVAPVHLIQIAGKESAGLAGNGVAPGELSAEVVVATAFDANLDVRNKILVVHHIDPGWTLLFTQAAGIIAEKGNALSHAAIIAREIGIPAIVAVANATRELKTGDRITINGITGGITVEEN